MMDVLIYNPATRMLQIYGHGEVCHRDEIQWMIRKFLQKYHEQASAENPIEIAYHNPGGVCLGRRILYGRLS